MNHLSLFSGIGGIDLAAEWAGFHSVAMVEKDLYCQQVLRKHFPEAELHGDILEFDGTIYENRIDLISAGFPCQPFSLAGSRKGADDERALWPEVVRVLREVKPTWFLGENVPGLLTSGTQYKGEYFNYICNSLSEMGYRVGWCLFGAKDIGAVHRRNRVFIVAYSSNAGLERQRQRGAIANCSATYSDGIRHSKYSNKEGQQFSDGRKAQCRVEGHDSCVCGRDVADSESKSGNGSGLESQFNPNSPPPKSGSRTWQRISGGNWREWDTCPIIYETRAEPRVRRANDGIPHRVDRLKCLGNAVVPQQVFPILEEIARQMKCD